MSSKRNKTVHGYRVRGNLLDLIKTGKNNTIVLHKRMFITPEFLELFFSSLDNDFDANKFRELSDTEKRSFAHAMSFLNIKSNAFNIELSKMTRNMQSRMRTVEQAIKIGNLNKELKDEYIDIVTSMKHFGMVSVPVGSRMINTFLRTYP